MKQRILMNTTNLLISLVLLGLFVLLGTLSFQADSAPSTSYANPSQHQGWVQSPSSAKAVQP